jgi:quercetin dioxygenase-like cupin family protein
MAAHPDDRPPGAEINRTGAAPHRYLTQLEGVEEPWKRLLALPRVRKAKDIPDRFKDEFRIRFANLDELGMNSLTVFFEEYPPSGVSQAHAHQNGAIFYVLDGEGYEIHDGKKFHWEAGDVVIIPQGCVHRHVNASQSSEARVLVLNPKPVYWLFNLRAQGLVHRPGEGPV